MVIKNTKVEEKVAEVETNENESIEPTLSEEDRTAIVSQAIKEMQFSRRYKQGKIRNWQKNEQLYYGKKMEATESRSNVDLGRMQEFVHTLLSKISAPL